MTSKKKKSKAKGKTVPSSKRSAKTKKKTETKAKVKRTKKAVKCKRRNQKGKYDWGELGDEYLCSGLSLAAFAKSKKIPYITARKHIKAVCKKGRIVGLPDSNAIKFKKEIQNAAIEESKTLYVESLTQSHVLFRRMIEDLALHWADRIQYRSAFLDANQIGRLAALAADKLKETAGELQGIPDVADKFGWPLTKGFWPFDYQRDFIFDLPSAKLVNGKPLFHMAFVGGIGSGKTRCGAEKFGDIAFRNRGCMHGIYAPTYRMLEDSTKRVFLDVTASKGIAYKYRPSDNSMLLFGDTKIIFRSMDDPEHTRGPELGGAWIDEGGQMSTRKAVDRIAGRVRDPSASEPCVLHTTTPFGFNWFHDMVVEEAETIRAIVYHAKTRQNIALSPDYVERLTDLYDDRFAKQELEGEFVDVFVGQLYWQFERGSNVTNEFDYDQYLPLLLAFDLNVDPMCWNIGQQFRGNGHAVTVFFDEIHLRTSSTDEALTEFKRRYGNHKAGLHIYGDSTWRSQKSTATTRTDYDVIKAGLNGIPGIEIHIGRSNPAITDSVAAMNAQLKDVRGRRKLVFHPRCKFTIQDMERVAFKEGTREIDKSNKKLTHHSDAVRYYVAKEFPILKPVVTLG